MKHHNYKRLLLIAIVAVLMLALPSQVSAVLPGKNVTIYPGVNIYINDKKLEPKDANGNPVEVFAYNGTTYLPVRAVSEALGQPVQWDGGTSSVYIGKHNEEKPAVWLSDLDYFDKNGRWTIGETTKDNLGNEHGHSFEGTTAISDGSIIHQSITYKLNAQYSRLTGWLYQLYDRRAHHVSDTVLSVYGDGELIWKGTVNSGIDPIAFDINVKGVLELEIHMDADGNSAIGYGALGDVGLWI